MARRAIFALPGHSSNGSIGSMVPGGWCNAWGLWDMMGYDFPETVSKLKYTEAYWLVGGIFMFKICSLP